MSFIRDINSVGLSVTDFSTVVLEGEIAMEQPSAMPLWLFVMLISVTGFTVAGLANAFRSLMKTESTTLRLSFDGPISTTSSFLVCMFAGPYWVGAKAWQFWRDDKLPLAILGFFSALAIMWSFCSGVVVLQILYSFGFV